MNEILLKNKKILITAGILISFLIIVLLGMIYLGKPEVIVLRAIDSISKSIEDIANEKIEKGTITTDTRISTDIEIPIFFNTIKLKDININNVNHLIDKDYSDMTLDITYGDMKLPSILEVFTNDKIYAKVSEISDTMYIIKDLIKENSVANSTNDVLNPEDIKDITKIFITAVFKKDTIKSTEKININGNDVKCTKHTLTFTGEEIKSIILEALNTINKNTDLKQSVDKYLSLVGAYKDLDEMISSIQKVSPSSNNIELNIYSKGLGSLVKIEAKVIGEKKDTYAITILDKFMTIQYNRLYININYSNINQDKGNVVCTIGSPEEIILSTTLDYTVKEIKEGEKTIDIIAKFTEKEKKEKTLTISINSIIDTKNEVKKIEVTNAVDITELSNEEKNNIYQKLQTYFEENSSNILDNKTVEIGTQTTQNMADEVEEMREQLDVANENNTKNEENMEKAKNTVTKSDLANTKSIISTKFATDMAENNSSILLDINSDKETRTCAALYMQEILEYISSIDENIDFNKYIFLITVKKSANETYICQAIVSENEEKIMYKLNGKTVTVDDAIVTGTVTNVSVENQ